MFCIYFCRVVVSLKKKNQKQMEKTPTAVQKKKQTQRNKTFKGEAFTSTPNHKIYDK